MRLSVIGCGYVGLVTGACLAEAGHEVICTDVDRERIAKLNAGGVPIYEHHLDQILASAHKAGRISYTADAGEANLSRLSFGQADGQAGDGWLGLELAFTAPLHKAPCGLWAAGRACC